MGNAKDNKFHFHFSLILRHIFKKVRRNNYAVLVDVTAISILWPKNTWVIVRAATHQTFQNYSYYSRLILQIIWTAALPRINTTRSIYF